MNTVHKTAVVVAGPYLNGLLNKNTKAGPTASPYRSILLSQGQMGANINLDDSRRGSREKLASIRGQSSRSAASTPGADRCGTP